MAIIILDVGSGNSLPEISVARDVVDAIASADTHRHEVILKAQLFTDAPPNKPLNLLLFANLFNYAKSKGYKVTASVFDKPSLEALLTFDPCFVKIACRPELYWLMGEVPRRIPIYCSYDGSPLSVEWGSNVTWLFCIPEYPARKEHYLNVGPSKISDHTVGLEVFNILKPRIWEKHFILDHRSDNPDAGDFAITPSDLKEIL